MYKRILLSINLDHGKVTQKAAQIAAEMTRYYNGKLFVLSVVQTPSSLVAPYVPENFERDTLVDTKKQVEQFVTDVIPNDLDVSVLVRTDTVYRQILDVAKELDIDVIVMGSHHPEVGDFLLGTNAAKITRHANCSVFIVRD